MRDHFGSILGRENALENENELLAYGYDASGKQGKARLVLFPKTDEHIRKILTYANRTNIPVVPRGLGCNTLGMVVPQNAIVIDMAHFDRIHTIDLKQGFVHVDVGVVAADLQRMLLEHGYSLPVTPKSIDVSTIGGLLATNAMDRRSHKNGRLKDHVERIEIIDGTGKHYPDGNLGFIGMEGTGAIILRAIIKIVPVVTQTTTDMEKHETLTDVLGRAEELKDDLDILSLEYLSPKTAELSGLDPKHHLFVEYRSDKGKYVNQEQQERLWKKRDDAWDTATKEGYPYIEDCRATGEALYEVLAWCEDIDLPVVAHIGLGIVHPFFDREDREDFYEVLRAVGADLSGQFGYGIVKKDAVPKHVTDAHIKLKDEYDYNDIVNRGMINDYA